MHALIIEDEGLVFLLVRDFLEDLGFETFDRAVTQAEAIMRAREKCPDFIAADVNLVTGNGIDAVEQICRIKPIPVVFITSMPGEVLKRMPDALVAAKPLVQDRFDAMYRRSMERFRS